mmetsp:Transcript_16776/g.38597  ORF Transcript_16776/g.38597 Transcript_16776/m.38597 type:complete len:450 (-) Transcript_16776:2105-3454(-)
MISVHRMNPFPQHHRRTPQMKTTDTALLGHVSDEALAAAALSDLWTMCTAVLIMGRVLAILVGTAVGADNPKLAGIYLQVAYFVLSFVAVFVMIAWYFTKQVWILFGSAHKVSDMAGYYARVLSLSIPGLVLFGQLSQFFTAQRIMHPEVNASSIALIMNLVLGLTLVLGIPFPGWNGFGFPVCPIVTSSVVYIQLAVILIEAIWIEKLHKTCWGGWSWQEITRERIKTFSVLYFPAAFSIASDFWRVAVIGAVAAKLGSLEVAVFNTSYRIMWIVLIIVNAISQASSIKMSIRLGDLKHVAARQAGHVGLALCLLVLVIISGVVVGEIRIFGEIFSSDADFLDLFATTRWPFTATLFFMNLSIALEKIPFTMGRTTEVFWMGFVASWAAQVPAVILLTTYWRADLVGLYSGMAIGYIVLCILYSIITFTSDWEKYAKIARSRAETAEN